ncbi:glycoside hydrolase family 92 protein [Fomitiporia mediterranea MF3/22]|uniref:glycoside hydrolase family 92 protein n=1 Tax=Fomitiporia mediterranea (strain MF3/22) TaxID=694068 RepID=UPI0004408EEA|nr:glycoside hydrolase family 92 protein [Fomitiporia mediterranea MF3/22]EJD01967.1 glycoside hydrolase family 92 protein [Fomitiporia mediterranea MF3/22]
MILTGTFLLFAYTGDAFAHVPRTTGSTSSGPRSSALNLSDPLSLVNVFIGTTNGGNVFPGATVPHGMVKVGMDTDSPQAGYDANSTFNATGFSQLHDSGTGGGVPLSNFKLWPFASCNSTFESCQTSIDGRKAQRKILGDGTPDDFGSPGYFSTNLSTGIRVELTSTRRTALHRYTFPQNSTEPRLVVDVTNDGQQSNTNPFMTVDPNTGHVVGGAEFAASFGPGRYSVFACFDFRGDGYNFTAPTEYGSWLGNFPVRFATNLNQVYFGFVSELGALLTFPPNPSPDSTTTILARVGVSFISTDQACANAESEIPDFNFDETVAASQSQWKDILNRVQVNTTDVDDETVELLYSSLYRTHISPADYTGENPKWNSTEPYYDSLYCNWDTFRTLYPLYSLHDPENFALAVANYSHMVFLDADPILGEFFVKFHNFSDSLNVSATDLYNALLADAEDQPPNWDLQGRQANIWKMLGYIPGDIFEMSGTNTKQVSRTLEHAFGDFAISQVAQLLGKSDDVVKYQNRSGNFFNVWNPNTTVPGGPDFVKGMVQPRFANGTFNHTDPRHCSVNDPLHSTCFLNAANRDGFYESSPIVYSQFVPHDTARLIELQGGNESFVSRLNFIFDEHYFDATDEPSQQIPFMYHYANRPGLSTQRSRQVIASDFNTSVNGLPGNDDSGAMASYVFFYLAGLYPIPATRQYLLSSPYFPQVSFFNPLFNSTTTIIANGFRGNPSDGTGGNVFVESVKVNGERYKSNCYLDFDVFENGSTIELQLSSNINNTCGNGPNALPPSLSTGGFSSP